MRGDNCVGKWDIGHWRQSCIASKKSLGANWRGGETKSPRKKEVKMMRTEFDDNMEGEGAL